MRRAELLKILRTMAAAAGAEMVSVRNRGGHEVYKIAGRILPIPNHTEIKRFTAENIIDDAAKAIALQGQVEEQL